MFQAGAYNRRFGPQERNGLTLHARTNQSTVCIIVLNKRNQCSGKRCTLVGRYIHIPDLFRLGQLMVSVTIAGGYTFTIKITGLIYGRIRLRDNGFIFLLGREKLNLICDLSILYDSIRRFNKAKIIYFGMYTERSDQTDIRSFRSFNRAESSIGRIVHVSNVESCPLPCLTTRTQSRHPALVRALGSRVRLVHKLRQLVRAKETVDDAGNGSRIYQILRSQLFSISGVHSLADGSCHPGQANCKLLAKLFAYYSYTSVTQVINIVYLRFHLFQTNDLFDNGNNVFLGQVLNIGVNIHLQPLIKSVPAYFSKIIFFIIEEESFQNLSGSLRVGHLSGSDLLIDLAQCRCTVVRRILSQGIHNNRAVRFF